MVQSDGRSVLLVAKTAQVTFGAACVVQRAVRSKIARAGGDPWDLPALVYIDWRIVPHNIWIMHQWLMNAGPMDLADMEEVD